MRSGPMENHTNSPIFEAARGLTSEVARQRLLEFGSNSVKEAKPHPLLSLLAKFWAPVPWMLEATIVLELILGRLTEAVIVGLLLAFNASLGFFQERRAEQALAMLRQRLAVQARVLRDGHWKMVAAEGLVPGDVIHVRMGDLVPADMRLADGSILLDQSALTGESAPVEAAAGASAYAGTVVKRGEATGEVSATGARTTFGRTAELVRTAKTAGHLQEIIFSIVKYLVAVDAGLVAILLIYSFSTHMLLRDVLPFALMLLVASVPVALPATFTLAAALGTQELAKRGVLVSRLSAIEEAAAMDVLASDKTGTITQNSLSLAQVCAYAPFTEQDVLRLASFACDEATQDPIDLAILKAARERGTIIDAGARIQFVPFDPATKRSEALVREAAGTIRVVKGAPAVVAAIAAGGNHLNQDVESLAAEGSRILAVAAGEDGSLRIAGLLGLLDPPRTDSAALVAELHSLGVRVLMVTGDSVATARASSAASWPRRPTRTRTILVTASGASDRARCASSVLLRSRSSAKAASSSRR